LATLSVILVILAVAGGCGRKEDRAESTGESVRVDGSSTVFLVSEAEAKEFHRAGLGSVAVAASGTTGGLRKFCRGEIDIAGASRPIEPDEVEACRRAGIEFIELPIGYDGISVVVNPKNNWVDHLTVAELRRIWEAGSTISSWKQVREGFPDRPLHLYGPGGDSGTFDYFTLAINGKERSSRTDYTGSEDDNDLVHGVAVDEGGLGYFGYAYFVENWNKLKLLAIDDGIATNGDGPVAPSQQTVATGTYQPLSRPIFIYVSARSALRTEVSRFVTFYLDHARKVVADAGYIALPARADDLAKSRYQSRKIGTAFSEGARLGLTVEELYTAESR
jgi:phosphate transport system substrate-binding protein